MNVVDSSGWLEYFAEGDNAGFFAPAIEHTDSLIVPVICIHEVFKKVLQNQGLAMADSIILAIAREHEATLWTQDEHFRNLPDVKYIEKK